MSNETTVAPAPYCIVTTRGGIASVAARWRRQYYKPVTRGEPPVWQGSMGDGSEAIYQRLAALDPATATAADVTAIIGNASWTTLRCHACRQEVGAVARFDDGETTTDLCGACLSAAAAQLALLPPEG